MTDGLTMSPIELSWTAKKKEGTNYQTTNFFNNVRKTVLTME